MRPRRNLKTWVALCVSLLAMAQIVPGRTIYVDANGLADFNNIQAAIDDANDGDTVIVNPGTYTGDGNRDIDFLGKASTVRSTDPNNPNIVATTIIDCNGTQEDPHRGFYFHNNEDANSVLVGLTITGGYGPRAQIFTNLESVGGAILCDASRSLSE